MKIISRTSLCCPLERGASVGTKWVTHITRVTQNINITCIQSTDAYTSKYGFWDRARSSFWTSPPFSKSWHGLNYRSKFIYAAKFPTDITAIAKITDIYLSYGETMYNLYYKTLQYSCQILVQSNLMG